MDNFLKKLNNFSLKQNILILITGDSDFVEIFKKFKNKNFYLILVCQRQTARSASKYLSELADKLLFLDELL